MTSQTDTDTPVEAPTEATAEAEETTETSEAPDLETVEETEQTEATDPEAEEELQGAAPEFDVAELHDHVRSIVDLSNPGASVSPLEPTDGEPSEAAVVLLQTESAPPHLIMIDGSSESEELDITAAIEALSSRFSETLGMQVVSGADLDDVAATAMFQATTFRTQLSTPDGPLGEIRLVSTPVQGIAEVATDAPVEQTGQPEQIQQQAAAAQPANPDMENRLPNLAAVDMDISVELGRIKLSIRELLGLSSGSVIRLGTPVGESFDILVNGKCAARGDLVVVGGRLAVRIREILGVVA